MPVTLGKFFFSGNFGVAYLYVFANASFALVIDDFQLINDQYVLQNNIANCNYDVRFPLSYEDDEEWAIN